MRVDRAEFAVVVAAAMRTRGIGRQNAMPWRLAPDMAFFKQLTRSTIDAEKRNAVVMGRKTWTSIPSKMRPLADRLNVVITANPNARAEFDIPDAVLVVSSLDEALATLCADEHSEALESVYVIGGASIYEEALKFPRLCTRVHLTEVSPAPPAPLQESNGATAAAAADAAAKPDEAADPFGCDTFFPALDDAAWKLDKAGPLKTDGKLSYRFLSYVPSSPGAAPTASAGAHEEYQYLNLVRDVIQNGVARGDRTGTGTLSKFGVQMRFSLRESFPLLTTKRVFWRGVAEELLWFVSGDTSAKTLQDKGIKIWDGNSARSYLDSIGLTEREEGDLGPVYGWQWRHFGAQYVDMHTDYTGQGVDQLAEVVHKIKNNPNDRRIIMSAWNPADLKKMALPPCHMFAQFYVANGELSCQMYQRSADLGLGVPFNIASYALLTCLLAHVCGLKRGDFVHVLGDAHVYSNHVDALQEQLRREPRVFPQLHINERVTSIDGCTFDDLTISGYSPHGKIAMDMAV